jgi:hypothetical protein
MEDKLLLISSLVSVLYGSILAFWLAVRPSEGEPA